MMYTNITHQDGGEHFGEALQTVRHSGGIRRNQQPPRHASAHR